MTTLLLTTLVLTAVILLVVGLSAWVVSRRPMRYHRPADGEAVITGTCGDTMAIRIYVQNGRLADLTVKSKGCAYSFSCLQAAADTARGLTPLQALDIDADRVARRVGHIPEDHRHCATLAVHALHAAIDHYMRHRPAEAFQEHQNADLT